jgi:RHS repeat-associated protein
VRQTNLPLDYIMYHYDNQTPHRRAHFYKENSILAPCKNVPQPELETQIPTLAGTPAALSYPTALYQVMRSTGALEWFFGQELNLAGAGYERRKRLPVMNAQEKYSVQLKTDSTVVWTLTQLLDERQKNGLADMAQLERVIEKSPTNPCTLDPLNCTPLQIEKQASSLAEIRNIMCNMDPANITFPITLYLVQLCDGTTAYILGQDLLQQLHGPHIVLDQLVINGPDEVFIVVVTRPRPLFAMRFFHEPNGNINELQWKVTDYDVKLYGAGYDPLNRLTGAGYGVERIVDNGTGAPYIERIDTQEYDEFGIGYDAIGNIQSLSRRGLKPEGNCFEPGLIDQLTYAYGEEGRLTHVIDDAPQPFRPLGFKPRLTNPSGHPHYVYDKSGNLTEDRHKEMTMSYNFLNLPNRIQTQQGNNIDFLYDATGRKWAKKGTGNHIRMYIGNIEYFKGKLEHIAFPDGRLVPEYDENDQFLGTYRPEYFRTDHLGNTRLTFSDYNQDMTITTQDDPETLDDETEITAEHHYYPFGLSHTGPWYASVAPENKYRYNGKEWNEDFGLNMYDYGARGYMPDLGRWGGVDALAERYYSWSPYNYVLGNPIRNIDPDGNGVTNTIFIDGKGKELGRTIDDLPNAVVVVSNDNIAAFHQGFMRHTLSQHKSDGAVSSLRNLGDSYLVDGMNAVYDASMATTLPPGSGGYVDAKGRPIKNLHPEAGSYFNVSKDGKTLTVDPDIRVSESTDAIGLGGDRPSIHSHPIHGGLYKKTHGGVTGPANESEAPSARLGDYQNSEGRQRRNPSRYRDVVVGPNNIYLYKGYDLVGKAPRSFFKKG